MFFLGFHAGNGDGNSNVLYIHNSAVTPLVPLIYGEFDNRILKFCGLEVHQKSATGGGLARKVSEAVSAAMSGASVTIQVNIPAGAKLIGVQLRVDTVITSGDGATSWAAEWHDGSSMQAICTGQAFTANTKVNKMHDDNANTPITDAETDIVITPNSNTFSGGVIRAIAYYEEFEALGDA